MAKLNELEKRHYNSYTFTNGGNLQRQKANAIFIGQNETVKHELSKCLGAIMLNKWGDLLWDDDLNSKLDEVCSKVNELFDKWDLNKVSFLTEAVPLCNKKRRVDLVDLRKNVHFEFENKKSEKKDGAITIYIGG